MKPLSGGHPAAFIRLHGRAFFGFVLPFALILYLALRGGGYDPIVRGTFGAAVWATVIIGAATGLLATAGWTRAAWTVVGLFAAFAVWTGLAVIWSDSVEKTVSELARVAAYGGVLVLGLSFGTREDFKRIAAGVGVGLASVAVIALASRLHPAWFPENEAAEILPETIKRLNYPVGYWNALAAMVAIGIPLMLWLASSAVRPLVRAAAAAALPAMVLAAYMTLSRGGVVEIAIALIVFVCLHPRRLELLPTLVNTVLGGLVLVYLASRRADLSDGLDTATAAAQADQMILAVVVVALAVGLIEAGIAAAGRRGIGPRPTVSRQTSLRLLGVAAVALVVAGIAVDGPQRIENGWNTFKAPTGPSSGDTIQRFSSASGNGRYQYWSASVDAGKDDPLTGVGPGTWEFVWSKDGTLPGFVRDAHSLYLESFAELGIVGLLLICSLLGAVLVIAVRRTRRAPADSRVALAGATAACAAFATAAALDWSWELPVIPVAVMFIVGAIMTCERPAVARAVAARRSRLGFVAAAVVGAIAVALPLPGQLLIRSSQDSFNAGNLPQALDRAETASAWQPWAAAPLVQEALVLEQDGQLQRAQRVATEAVRHEPANWRNWYVLTRLAFHLGDTATAQHAADIARELNPRSPFLAQDLATLAQ